MKMNCKVIEDLLPIYHDGVCSEESRAVVEEHLGECEGCRRMLAEMDAEISVEKPEGDEARPLKRIRRRSLIRGIAIALVTITAVILLFAGATELRIFPVSTEKIEISELSRLENGAVAFHFYITDDAPLYRMSIEEDLEAGNAYLVPKRALFEYVPNYAREMLALNDRYYYLAFSEYTRAQHNDPEMVEKIWEERELYDTAVHMFSSEIQRIYMGTKSDNILLYERGTELPAASEVLQGRYDRGEYRGDR